MSTFETAYCEGLPVKVMVPQGFELIVVGYVEFGDRIGWMDDGFIDAFPGHPPLHYSVGKVRRVGNDLFVAEHRFSAVAHGDRVAGIWYDLFKDIDVREVQRSAEVLIRERYADQ